MSSANHHADAARRNLFMLPLVLGGLYLLGQSKEPKKPPFQVKEVLVEEVRLLLAAGALIVDVRQRAAYEERHIAGAISAPLAQLEVAIPAALAPARDLPIVVYCGDGSTLGPEGTHTLNQAGFAGAVNLKPGLKGWADAGLPIEHGKGSTA